MDQRHLNGPALSPLLPFAKNDPRSVLRDGAPSRVKASKQRMYAYAVVDRLKLV